MASLQVYMWHPQRFSGGWLCIDLYPQRFPVSLLLKQTAKRSDLVLFIHSNLRKEFHYKKKKKKQLFFSIN